MTVLLKKTDFEDGAPKIQSEAPKASVPISKPSWPHPKPTWPLVVVGFLVLIAGSLLLWHRVHPNGTAVQDAAKSVDTQIRLPIADIQRIAWTHTPAQFKAAGTVTPELQAALATKTLARVVAVDVHEGDRVTAGQQLVRLDPRELDAAVAKASGGRRSADAAYQSALVASRMEDAQSSARIAEAQAQAARQQAGLASAKAQRDLVMAGPRPQERAQAAQAVALAGASLLLAGKTLARMKPLFQQGAITAQQLDEYQSRYGVAEAQYESVRQAQSQAEEGSRAEDKRAAQSGILLAQAALNEAWAGLRQAQASALQTAMRRQDVQRASAQIGQSRADYAAAVAGRDYATIRAPFAGAITSRDIDPGSMAGPGVPLLKIQGGGLRLSVQVPESALSRSRVGMTVPFVVDALGPSPVRGRIISIAPQGDPTSHTFVVKVSLPSSPTLRSGMFGQALFPTGSATQMLVRTSAVFTRDGLQYVYTVDAANRAHLRLVTTGDSVGGSTPVLSGLDVNDRVVCRNWDRLQDGQAVALDGG